jgi:hypothetical protein
MLKRRPRHTRLPDYRISSATSVLMRRPARSLLAQGGSEALAAQAAVHLFRAATRTARVRNPGAARRSKTFTPTHPDPRARDYRSRLERHSRGSRRLSHQPSAMGRRARLRYAHLDRTRRGQIWTVQAAVIPTHRRRNSAGAARRRSSSRPRVRAAAPRTPPARSSATPAARS